MHVFTSFDPVLCPRNVKTWMRLVKLFLPPAVLLTFLGNCMYIVYHLNGLLIFAPSKGKSFLALFSHKAESTLKSLLYIIVTVQVGKKSAVSALTVISCVLAFGEKKRLPQIQNFCSLICCLI